MICSNSEHFPGRQRLVQWGVQRCPLERLSSLEPCVKQLSIGFTAERPEQFGVYLDEADLLTAYALAFAPQTYARVYAALQGVLSRLPSFPKRPLQVLDLGSGIGSAALAASDLLAEKTGFSPHVTCVDWSEAALQAVTELLSNVQTVHADLKTFSPSSSYDIILSSFAFNEVFPNVDAAYDAILPLLGALREDSPSFLLLLEPADRTLVPKFHALRDRLKAYPIYAPCPHGKRCPMVATQDGVCHDVRTFKPERPLTLLCRYLRGTVSEVKYALLAFGRKDGPQAEGYNASDFLRLVGPMNKRKGLLTCRVCMGDGTLKRLEIPSAALSSERRHALLTHERGDCAWLTGALEQCKQLEQCSIQRAADLHFTDEPTLVLDEAMDDFTFSV